MTQAAESRGDNLLDDDLVAEVAAASRELEAMRPDLVFVRCPNCRRVASSQEGVEVDGQIIALLLRVDGGWQLSRSLPFGHYQPPASDRHDLSDGVVFQLECHRRGHPHKVPASYLRRMADRARSTGHPYLYLRDDHAGVDPHAVRVAPWNADTYRPRPERRD